MFFLIFAGICSSICRKLQNNGKNALDHLKTTKNKTSLKKTLANDRELIEQPSPTFTGHSSETNSNFSKKFKAARS